MKKQEKQLFKIGIKIEYHGEFINHYREKYIHMDTTFPFIGTKEEAEKAASGLANGYCESREVKRLNDPWLVVTLNDEVLRDNFV